jgi:hypothetical protein
MLGIGRIGSALSETFLNEVVIEPDDGGNPVVQYAVNLYADQTFIYLTFLADLQGWIFCVRYWQSATLGSLCETCLTYTRIRVIGIVFGGLYFTA